MKTLVYNVQIITKTGLHIGSGNTKIEIGGMDQPVIKDRDGFPYIPASSLKGKLRSLYEITIFSEDLIKNRNDKNYGLKEFDGKNYDEVSMFFGKAGEFGNKKTDDKKQLENLGPTRFIFRDLKLSEFDRKKLENLKNSGESIFEEKTEVSINRFTGTSKQGALRPIERVPAGTIFEGKLIVRLLDKKEILDQYGKKSEKDILIHKFGVNLSILKELIENDYLGGQGSRGSGEIEINFIEEIKNDN
ncbi:MAG: type III-A CRISPR-associated RAMP protein Csm3 [Candidatus Gracilibacteria bacterium]|nr:type III-A CRISPR-associated RAMP protein Csm3 [Candidatus Gracilibacteria bacterium]